MGDLFGEWVPQEWIYQVIRAMDDAPQHTYQLLTKNPERMKTIFNQGVKVRPNFWLGASVGDCDASWSRVPAMQVLGDRGWHTFLSVEPLVTFPFIPPKNLSAIDWVIIGMQSNPLLPCEPEVIEAVVESARANVIPVFLKNSVSLCFGRSIVEPSREFPPGIRLNK
jgi:protein gp37